MTADYGNEVEAGQGVARAIKDGLVKRDELFIVSKLWNSFHDGPQVEPICRKQLADWGVDYFDLFIVHFPIALKYVDPSVRYPPGWMNADGKLELGNASIQETWTAMETLVDKKLARSIGVSNFSTQLLMDLLRYARVRPSTLQIEHHPYLTQTRLVDYAQKEGLAVTAYSSFGPLSFLELGLEHAQDTPPLFEHDVIKGIAQKHGRTPAQVLLRWATQRKVAVIPKSNNPTRLAQNLQVTDFDLEPAELKAISALDKGLRFNDPIAVSESPTDGLVAILMNLASTAFLSRSSKGFYSVGYLEARELGDTMTRPDLMTSESCIHEDRMNQSQIVTHHVFYAICCVFVRSRRGFHRCARIHQCQERTRSIDTFPPQPPNPRQPQHDLPHQPQCRAQRLYSRASQRNCTYEPIHLPKTSTKADRSFSRCRNSGRYTSFVV